MENAKIFFEKEDINWLVNKDKKQGIFRQIPLTNIQDLGFDCKPPKNYIPPKNFPSCCDYHKNLKEDINNWFEKFPFCCETHKQLIHHKFFKKENYIHIPEKIMNNISFTEYFIQQNISIKNWYKNITNYIEYVSYSFGVSPGVGVDFYIRAIKHYIQEVKLDKNEFTLFKRKKLLAYINSEFTYKNKESDFSDLNSLYFSFQKWLDSFPDLKFFQNLKKNFSGKMPLNLILNKPKEYNPYLNSYKSKAITNFELSEYLLNFTQEFLSKINTPTLIKKNHISNKETYQLEVLNASHQLRQKRITIKYSTEEFKYVNLLESWLENEQQYINELVLLLKNKSNPPEKNSKIEITSKRIERVYELIEEWENERIYGENPTKMKKAEIEIERLKKLIKGYEDELSILQL